MAKWIIKSGIQRVVSWFPYSHFWNQVLQKYVTRGLFLREELFKAKLGAFQVHWNHYWRLSAQPHADIVAFELGPGTYPIVPIAFFLCGAAHVDAYELAPVLSRFTLRQTLKHFELAWKEGRLTALLPNLIPSRMDVLHAALTNMGRDSVEITLRHLNIELTVGDARQTGLKEGSVDLVYSTLAFEHIDAEVLSGLLRKFLKLGNASAIHSHYIGIQDQFSQIDSSLTPYNYLRYTAAQWRWLDSPLAPQTRHRLSDYRRIFTQAGFQILNETCRNGRLEDLRTVTRAAEFKDYTEDDLLPLFAWIAARAEGENR
jgi:Methyltransferase domain